MSAVIFSSLVWMVSTKLLIFQIHFMEVIGNERVLLAFAISQFRAPVYVLPFFISRVLPQMVLGFLGS